MKKKFVIATVVALILSGSGIVQSQIICTIPCPVWDVQAVLNHGIIAAVQEAINEVMQKTNEGLYIANRTLASWSPWGWAGILLEDTPGWRRFVSWGDNDPNFEFINGMTWALSYGDATGAGYEAMSTPHLLPGRAIPDGLRTQLATIDLSDAVVTRATHDLGQLRFAGREQTERIQALQDMVLAEDEPETGMNYTLGKLTAQTLIEAGEQQAQIVRNTAIVELLAIQAKRDRDQAVDQLNLRLQQAQDAGEQWRETVTGGGAVLNRWFP